ncbi:hypothetical protein PISMIDRAFT_669858 [Pisolithus microcarpus 441]|uniref:Late embryogenesis abundant protein LEA-2 subgroup domain-containing protein n=1 Tax=Pisolithus microcarpus 441 TaxID=765257 RepID=A0A0D0AFM0_9AGAM|nr:hypothetical protein PISMIDRAFT_669858 [Pisolithus microcarpus 441]
MAYRDPFAERYGHYDQQYSEGPAFDPYHSSQPHPAYDQGGYDPYTSSGYRDNPTTHDPATAGMATLPPKEGNGLYSTGYPQPTTASRPRDLRRWRYEHHRSLWTKGSRWHCIGRFCCCTIMITLFFIVSIILALLLWARPPNVIVGNVEPSSTASEVQLESNGVQINLAINITVNNPNYFSVSFSSVKADMYYPINNTYIGGGNLSDVTFPSHTNKTITFPFSVVYSTTMPSSAEILANLATQCGLTGGTKSDITIDYDITLGLRVLFFTVSPTVSSSASFLCPLSSSDLSGLSSILGGIA